MKNHLKDDGCLQKVASDTSIFLLNRIVTAEGCPASQQDLQQRIRCSIEILLPITKIKIPELNTYHYLPTSIYICSTSFSFIG